jgi:hypothetical protein
MGSRDGVHRPMSAHGLDLIRRDTSVIPPVAPVGTRSDASAFPPERVPVRAVKMARVPWHVACQVKKACMVHVLRASRS